MNLSDNKWKNEFCLYINHRRTDLGMSVNKFSSAIGMSHTTYHDYERKKRSPVSKEKAQYIINNIKQVFGDKEVCLPDDIPDNPAPKIKRRQRYVPPSYPTVKERIRSDDRSLEEQLCDLNVNIVKGANILRKER